MANGPGQRIKTDVKENMLTLDDCAARSNLNFLTNIQMQFLPPNTIIPTNGCGNYENLEIIVSREAGLPHSLRNLRQNANIIRNSMINKYCRNVLQAVQLIVDSWRAVSFKAIQNSFHHCGFEQPELELEALVS